MRYSQLPVTACHTNCTKCGLPVDFQVFESGAGGEFETYFGRLTQSFYRLDLGQVKYLGKSLGELLAPAIAHEQGADNLLLIPAQVSCKFCGTLVTSQSYSLDAEVNINAYQL